MVQQDMEFKNPVSQGSLTRISRKKKTLNINSYTNNQWITHWTSPLPKNEIFESQDFQSEFESIASKRSVVQYNWSWFGCCKTNRTTFYYFIQIHIQINPSLDFFVISDNTPYTWCLKTFPSDIKLSIFSKMWRCTSRYI